MQGETSPQPDRNMREQLLEEIDQIIQDLNDAIGRVRIIQNSVPEIVHEDVYRTIKIVIELLVMNNTRRNRKEGI
jgi:hypothetical protein